MKNEENKVTTKPVQPQHQERVCIEEDVDGQSLTSIFCADLENKFLFVRVGTVDEPATDEQIAEVGEKLEKLLEEAGVNCITFVTHHAVTVEIIEKKGI